MPFGHRGGNHPVQDLSTGKVEITSQNHGFCIEIDSLDQENVEMTHVNLNDGTLEGIRLKIPPRLVSVPPGSVSGRTRKLSL